MRDREREGCLLAEGGGDTTKVVEKSLICGGSDGLGLLDLLKDDSTHCSLQLTLLQSHTAVHMITLVHRVSGIGVKYDGQ